MRWSTGPAWPGWRAPATCARCCPGPRPAIRVRCSAATDGLDAIVFTGGVGENSAEIRSRAADGLGFLGVRVDESRNAGNGADDYDIGADSARVRAFVIAAREDKQIAGEVRSVLAR